MLESCPKCKARFEWHEEDAWWTYFGEVDVKLTKCPQCGRVLVVKEIEPPNRNSWNIGDNDYGD